MISLARFFIDNYKFTFVLSLGVVVFGYMGLTNLKSESYPAVDFAMATVVTSYDGASAEDIETRITKPVEDEIRSVSGIKDVRSTSQPGLSTILVRADIDNVNVKEVMSELQRAIDRVTDLPSDLKDPPKFTEIKSEEFPVIEVAVVGDNAQRRRDKVATLLKESIEDNKAVLGVRRTGFRERAFQIRLDTEKMRRFHIGIDEVTSKISLRNVNIPGGKLERTQAQQLVRIEGKIKSKEDIEGIIIRANFSGNAVRLGDIATVEDSQEDAVVLSQYNGEDATLLVVNKKGGSDTIKLVDDINSKIEQFTSTHPEFKFIIYNNESNRVKSKLGILSSNAVTGLGLVVFFLLLFLPGRIGLVASLSLPLGVLATIGFIPVLDMNLNAITILALVIALGMLVDNSVVIAENYARLRGEGEKPSDAAALSIAQLWLPITATVFTTISAFLPMLVTKGIMGEFIKYIPIIVTIALLISLAESFFLLPMRLLLTDGKQTKLGGTKSGWFHRFSEKFEAFTRKAVHYRYISLMVFTAALIGSGVMMSVFNKMILFPADQTEIYISRVELSKGATLKDTEAVVRGLAKNIQSTIGTHVDHLVARAGSAQVGPADPKGRDGDVIGSVFIYVNENAKNNVPDKVILNELRAIAKPDNAKELTFEAQVNGPPVGEPVNATFRSNNMESLETVIGKMTAALSARDGIIDVKVDDIIGEKEVYVDIDYKKADRLGLDVDRIGNSIRSAISGKVVSSVNLNNTDIDLKVRFQETQRLSVDDLKNLQIMDRNGNLVPVSTIAKFRLEEGSPYIKRFDFKRSKTVTANIVEGSITAIEANGFLASEFDKVKNDFPDVSMIFGGEGESTNESMSSLFDALILSLIGIFALLVFLFNSLLRPLIIMTTIPLGLVGFSIAFALHGRPISFLALIGIIGLGGIIVNSGIILISFIEELKKTTSLQLEEILARASRIRLRAVVVSSLTTISGLLPTAYGIGGSDAFLMPMTLAMAWGLTSGTILTLVWVPCAYAIVEDFTSIGQRVFLRLKPEPMGATQNVFDERSEHSDREVS